MVLDQADIKNSVCDPLIGIDFQQHHLIRKGNFDHVVNFIRIFYFHQEMIKKRGLHSNQSS